MTNSPLENIFPPYDYYLFHSRNEQRLRLWRPTKLFFSTGEIKARKRFRNNSRTLLKGFSRVKFPVAVCHLHRMRRTWRTVQRRQFKTHVTGRKSCFWNGCDGWISRGRYTCQTNQLCLMIEGSDLPLRHICAVVVLLRVIGAAKTKKTHIRGFRVLKIVIKYYFWK